MPDIHSYRMGSTITVPSSLMGFPYYNMVGNGTKYRKNRLSQYFLWVQGTSKQGGPPLIPIKIASGNYWSREYSHSCWLKAQSSTDWREKKLNSFNSGKSCCHYSNHCLGNNWPSALLLNKDELGQGLRGKDWARKQKRLQDVSARIRLAQLSFSDK